MLKKETILKKVNPKKKKLKKYFDIIEKEEATKIKKLFSNISGKRILHINSTSKGGGVAQILESLVPLMQDGGVNCSWYKIHAQKSFFEITKKIHNNLQGEGKSLTKKEKEEYLSVSKKIAEELKKKKFDLLVVHDPQPVGSLIFHNFSPVILRFHLDTSSFKKKDISFFTPIINRADRVVFSDKNLVIKNILPKIKIIPPATDPFSDTNKEMPKKQLLKIMEDLGVDTKKPIISQISRFDKFKNPSGVLDIYKEVKKKMPEVQLILFGLNKAQDDPEAEEIFMEVKKKSKNDKDVFLFFNPKEIEKIDFSEKEIVNAIQRESDVVLQNSYKEAFGLTITEAMWKGTPVLGGEGLGVKKQIKDGKNGYIVKNKKEGAKKTIFLLENKKKSKEIGKRGKESVQKQYLLTKLLKNHLLLYLELLD